MIAKALAKRSDERYPSCTALVEAVRSALGLPGGSTDGTGGRLIPRALEHHCRAVLDEMIRGRLVVVLGTGSAAAGAREAAESGRSRAPAEDEVASRLAERFGYPLEGVLRAAASLAVRRGPPGLRALARRAARDRRRGLSAWTGPRPPGDRTGAPSGARRAPAPRRHDRLRRRPRARVRRSRRGGGRRRVRLGRSRSGEVLAPGIRRRRPPDRAAEQLRRRALASSSGRSCCGSKARWTGRSIESARASSSRRTTTSTSSVTPSLPRRSPSRYWRG